MQHKKRLLSFSIRLLERTKATEKAGAAGGGATRGGGGSYDTLLERIPGPWPWPNSPGEALLTILNKFKSLDTAFLSLSG